jgi:DNA-binding NarL/FixJ family response regulator
VRRGLRPDVRRGPRVRAVAGAAAPHEPHRPTDRELDVVAPVADGRRNAEIGAQLYITAGTVKTHLASIQQKLGVTNRVAIAARARETGHRRPVTP